MEIFQVDEIAAISKYLPTDFPPDLTADTLAFLDDMADDILTELCKIQTNDEKKLLIVDSFVAAIITGMLIVSRRINLDSILYTAKTGMEN